MVSVAAAEEGNNHRNISKLHNVAHRTLTAALIGVKYK